MNNYKTITSINILYSFFLTRGNQAPRDLALHSQVWRISFIHYPRKTVHGAPKEVFTSKNFNQEINQINIIIIIIIIIIMFGMMVSMSVIQEVPGSIPGYTLEIFVEVQGLEWVPPSLVRTIGQLLDMRSSEIRLRKLKLRLRDNALLTTRPPVLPCAATISVGLGSSELLHHGF